MTTFDQKWKSYHLLLSERSHNFLVQQSVQGISIFNNGGTNPGPLVTTNTGLFTDPIHYAELRPDSSNLLWRSPLKLSVHYIADIHVAMKTELQKRGTLSCLYRNGNSQNLRSLTFWSLLKFCQSMNSSILKSLHISSWTFRPPFYLIVL